MNILSELLPFLVILNPFALCLYLEDAVHELDQRSFMRTVGAASAISVVTFWTFALGGRPLLVRTLGVQPEALRLFGGLIFLVIAYDYVRKGHLATAELRGSLRHFPSAIAFPYMIGAGTITQSILVGEHVSTLPTILILLIGVAIAFIVLVVFKVATDHLKKRRENLFYHYMDIMARLNGLIIGAVSTQMIVFGARALWTLPK